MPTSPKAAQNAQFAAFPSLFKRTGEARRVKGSRASREMFNKVMRVAKVLELSPRLMVITPVGAMVLNEQATSILKADGGISNLLLNGFEVVPAPTWDGVIDIIEGFAIKHNVSLKQVDMFEEGDE